MKTKDLEKQTEQTIRKDIVPNFVFGNPFKCTYCGEPPNSFDHVIPLTQYSSLSRREIDKTGIRTYACQSCNSTLGDKYFAIFNDRIQFVQSKIIEKAQKYKRNATWTDEEIAELDHTLRTHVANAQLKMRIADRRTTWTTSTDFMACMQTLNDVPHLDEESPKFIEWVFQYFAGYT